MMTDNSELLEKGHTVCVAETPLVHKDHLSLSQTAGTVVKLPEMDQIVEHTLLSAKPRENLTKRETEILKLIVAGNTNKEIAQKLYRAERTVEYHRHRLMRKVGSKRAADLVKNAIAMGLV